MDEEARNYRSDLLAYGERRQSIVRRGAFTFWHRLIEGNRRTCASPENPASSVTSNNSIPVPLGTALSISCFCAFGRLGCACVPRLSFAPPSLDKASLLRGGANEGGQSGTCASPVLPQFYSGQKKQELGKKLLRINHLTGGAKGSRTPDLLNAIQALSQLSYGPTQDAMSGRSRPKLK